MSGRQCAIAQGSREPHTQRLREFSEGIEIDAHARSAFHHVFMQAASSRPVKSKGANWATAQRLANDQTY